MPKYLRNFTYSIQYFNTKLSDLLDFSAGFQCIVHALFHLNALMPLCSLIIKAEVVKSIYIVSSQRYNRSGVIEMLFAVMYI